MTTKAITPLRQRMIEDMNARKLCAGTQRGHIRSCKRFAAFLKQSPDTATCEDIRGFQLHLAGTGMSICNRNRIMTGLRFLFRVTLRRLDLAEEVYHIREPQKLPLVMSVDEMKRLLAVASSLKTRVLLSLGYGCGLRASEIVRLKVKHIDSAQNIIRIEQSKGRKDPQCDALSRNARSAAAMVEGASVAQRCGSTPAGTWAISQQKDCWQGDHHAASQSIIPRSGRRGGDQETRDGAYAAPQLRHPSARWRHRYQEDPGAPGSREIGNHGALSPRRDRHDLRHRESARPAGTAKAQEAQENRR
jgi:Phage integrase family/Phage integrase, N-terminal SAM-like domain